MGKEVKFKSAHIECGKCNIHVTYGPDADLVTIGSDNQTVQLTLLELEQAMIAIQQIKEYPDINY